MKDSLSLMMDSFSGYPVPDKAEAYRLIRSAQGGDVSSRNELVMRNMTMCVSVAWKHRGRGPDVEDLVQEGSIGLIRAIEKFDTGRDVEFSTYAYWWVVQAVQRHIDLTSSTIRLPVHWRSRYEHDSQAYAKFKSLATCLSLEEPIGTNTFVADVLAEPDGLSPGDSLDRIDELKELQEKLARLDERRRSVLNLRSSGMTLEEIARGMNVTRERVRQLEMDAFRKLSREYDMEDRSTICGRSRGRWR